MNKKVIASGMIILILVLTGCTNAMSRSMNGNMNTNMGYAKPNHAVAQSITGKESLESKFAFLSSANTNFCAGPAFINQKSDDDTLQGSCCSAMDLHRYKEQVDGLKKYSSINKIPLDPYDISVSLAKELLAYQKNISLTSQQQMVYDEAVKLSPEKGPCCCKCWRYEAFAGLGKYLITEHNFNAQQVAEVWELLDGCGGKGHEHGMQA